MNLDDSNAPISFEEIPIPSISAHPPFQNIKGILFVFGIFACLTGYAVVGGLSGTVGNFVFAGDCRYFCSCCLPCLHTSLIHIPS